MGDKREMWIFLWFRTLLVFQIPLPTVTPAVTNCVTIFKMPQEGLVNYRLFFVVKKIWLEHNYAYLFRSSL